MFASHFHEDVLLTVMKTPARQGLNMYMLAWHFAQRLVTLSCMLGNLRIHSESDYSLGAYDRIEVRHGTPHKPNGRRQPEAAGCNLRTCCHASTGSSRSIYLVHRTMHYAIQCRMGGVATASLNYKKYKLRTSFCNLFLDNAQDQISSSSSRFIQNRSAFVL
jgi:hypothetical protein